MKVAFEIDDWEVMDEVKAVVIKRTVEKIEDDLFHDGYGNYNRRIYSDEIKSAVRSLMKEHIEQIVERAVGAAADQIARKGLKKMIDEGKI